MPADDAVIQVILVPAGAEYRAVSRALKQTKNGPQIIPIPAGPQAVQTFLAEAKNRAILKSGGVLLMGLGGSLSPQYDIGDGVLIEGVWDGMKANELEACGCDRPLTHWLSRRLAASVKLGNGVTCDRVITTAAEKQQLRDRYGAAVVDMESVPLLRASPYCKIAILRVISDDCHHDLPEISNAIGPDGSIKPILLALNFLKRPLAAMWLIRGSLKGLKALEKMTVTVCDLENVQRAQGR
ncbi:MAG: hypothetical protein AAFW84_02730 [Cyanobacteria bacterium J06635_15]